MIRYFLKNKPINKTEISRRFFFHKIWVTALSSRTNLEASRNFLRMQKNSFDEIKRVLKDTERDKYRWYNGKIIKLKDIHNIGTRCQDQCNVKPSLQAGVSKNVREGIETRSARKYRADGGGEASEGNVCNQSQTFHRTPPNMPLSLGAPTVT